MNKRQKKIDIIKKYINNASGNWTAYSYGNIPDRQLSNACCSYANAADKREVLGLIDITVLGNGKKGMLFTENKIYYDNGAFGSRGSISYIDISNNNIPKSMMDSTYNQNALIEMISELARVEGASLLGAVKEFGDAIDGITDGVRDIQDTYNKGKEFFSALGSLFDEE